MTRTAPPAPTRAHIEANAAHATLTAAMYSNDATRKGTRAAHAFAADLCRDAAARCTRAAIAASNAGAADDARTWTEQAGEASRAARDHAAAAAQIGGQS